MEKDMTSDLPPTDDGRLRIQDVSYYPGDASCSPSIHLPEWCEDMTAERCHAILRELAKRGGEPKASFYLKPEWQSILGSVNFTDRYGNYARLSEADLWHLLEFVMYHKYKEKTKPKLTAEEKVEKIREVADGGCLDAGAIHSLMLRKIREVLDD